MSESKPVESLKLIILYALLFLGTFGGFFILKGLTGTEYPIMVVVSESMEPTLGVGDYILLHGVTDSIELGDIIVFPKPGSSNEYVVHRVVDKFLRGDVTYFRTQGDNPETNPVPDWWKIPEYSIIGKVYGRIPLIGYFSLFERTSGGILTIISMICLVFFIDYIIPPREGEMMAPYPHTENQGKNLSRLTIGLLILSVLPYPLFLLKGQFVLVEVFTLLCWYACDLLLPLAIRDEENSLMLWLFHFVLLILPVGTDLIYRFTGITPRTWWRNTHGTVPITWFLTGETSYYYRYLSTLGLLLLPGCILFFYSWGKKRRGRPLLKV